MSPILSLSKSEEFIKIYLKSAKENVDKLEVGKEINFNDVSTDLTLKVISRLAFGEQLNSKIDYIHPDGRVENMFLYESTHYLLDQSFDRIDNVMNHFFPFMVDMHWGKDNSIIHKNVIEIKRLIWEYFTEKMKEPIEQNPTEYPRVLLKCYMDKLCTKEEMVDDILGLIIAGHDTTSHAFITAMYCLGKHPEHLKTIKEEIYEVIFQGDKTKTYSDLDEYLTLDLINSMEFFSRFIKEC